MEINRMVNRMHEYQLQKDFVNYLVGLCSNYTGVDVDVSPRYLMFSGNPNIIPDTSFFIFSVKFDISVSDDDCKYQAKSIYDSCLKYCKSIQRDYCYSIRFIREKEGHYLCDIDFYRTGNFHNEGMIDNS